jgi:hypothetical protein
MPTTNIAGAAHRVAPAHGPDSPFQMLVIAFEAGIELVRGAMLDGGEDGP